MGDAVRVQARDRREQLPRPLCALRRVDGSAALATFERVPELAVHPLKQNVELLRVDPREAIAKQRIVLRKRSVQAALGELTRRRHASLLWARHLLDGVALAVKRWTEAVHAARGARTEELGALQLAHDFHSSDVLLHCFAATDCSPTTLTDAHRRPWLVRDSIL